MYIKKLLTIIPILFVMFVSQNTAAQLLCETYIQFRDNQGHNVFPIPQVIIQHTDSASHANNPIYYWMGKAERPFGYIDSFLLDTSMHDTAFTVNYFACGQWFSIDTVYSKEHANSRERILEMTISIPCVRSCDASFYISDYRLQHGGPYEFYAGQFNGSTQHEWDLGNGISSTSPNTSTYYDTVGPVIIKHIMRDTSRGCVDSSFQTLNFPPQCNGAFSHKDMGQLNYQFTSMATSNSYFNQWFVDSIFIDSGKVFDHHFTTNGYHTIRHINSYGSVCSDTFDKVIYVSPLKCVVQIGVSKNNQFITFTPQLSTIPYRYIFGDGDTLIQQGTVVHIYPEKNALYQVNINDVYSLCSPLQFNLPISISCSAAFKVSSDSNYSIQVTALINSSLSSRYILSNGDTLNAHSGTFKVTNSGKYTIHHQMLNNQGLAMCNYYRSVWVSDCGMIGNQWNTFKISGPIKFDNQYLTDFDSLRVYLIYHDSIANTLTAIDSQDIYSSIDSPRFEFDLVCDTLGSYLIKVALLPGSKYYANYLPTYAVRSTSWVSASPTYAAQSELVDLQAGNNPGGPGFIGGLISQGANKKFQTLDGIQVNIYNDKEEPVAYTFSANGGIYSFDNLDYGNYRVTVEELGKTSASYWLKLSSQESKVEELDFEVNSTFVSILSTGITKETSLIRNVFPNPANDRIFIEWTDNHSPIYYVSFYAMDGRLLKSEKLQPENNTQSELNISDLPRGLLMMLIRDEQDVQLLKVQIQ